MVTKQQYILIDPAKSVIMRYDKPVELPPNSGDLAFERNTGWLVYSTYPHFFDAESAAAFTSQQTKVTLFVNDIATGRQIKIAQQAGVPFAPRWVAPHELQYTGAGGRLVNKTISALNGQG